MAQKGPCLEHWCMGCNLTKGQFPKNKRQLFIYTENITITGTRASCWTHQHTQRTVTVRR